jgi:hypothetical protein
MGRLLSDGFGLVVTFFVPAVVWITLATGLFQFVREEVRQARVAPRRPQRLERYSQRIS